MILYGMPKKLEKFSSQMSKETLSKLRAYSESSKKKISDILTDAVENHLQQVELRPAFKSAVDKVIEQNKELLKSLAK